jgi:hypothetical protein
MKLFFRSIAGLVSLPIVTVRAEEGGAGHYAPGSFASFDDVLPGEPRACT